MAEQNSILTVVVDSGATTYVFTHRRTTADLSGLTDEDREGLAAIYWCANKAPFTAVKFLSKDADDQAALEAALSALSVPTPTVENIELTAAEQADISASGIRSKKHVPTFLSTCSAIRASNPEYPDLVVRALAKADFVSF